MSFITCHEANKERLCIECINFFKCGGREWRSCFSGEKEYWNQNIFVNELEGFLTKGDKNE